MRARRLILLGILVALSGCDNVTWGGISIRMETSGDRLARMDGGEVVVEPDTTEAGKAPDPEVGPLVLMGRPLDGSVRLALLGQLVEGTVASVPDDDGSDRVVAERLSAGRRLTLFSEGTRVGTLVVDASRLSRRFCEPRPEVVGTAELVPAATGAQQFLAVEAETLDAEYTGYADLAHTYDQRVASLAMMREVIPRVGAVWPSSTLDIRRDIQVFRRPEAEGPTIVATFVYEDGLRVGEAPAEAYSVFLMGDSGGEDYAISFASYRKYGEDGKAAPRYFDHLDWDGDGTSEIVLEVFGEDGLWASVLDRSDEGWSEVYRFGCGLSLPRSVGPS